MASPGSERLPLFSASTPSTLPPGTQPAEPNLAERSEESSPGICLGGLIFSGLLGGWGEGEEKDSTMPSLFSLPPLHHLTRLVRNICEQTVWNHSNQGTQTSRGRGADVLQLTEEAGCEHGGCVSAKAWLTASCFLLGVW